MEMLVTGPMPLIIGASGMDAIRQNIRTIILTTMYSVPLDRGFAHAGAALDSPAPLVTARLIAALTEAIEAREPRVAVERISLEAGDGPVGIMDGRFRPRVIFRLKEGLTL